MVMRHNAFTLTELLVVIGVLVILSAMAVPAFHIFGKKSDVANGTQELMSALRLAQGKSLASENSSRWGVYFDVSSTPNDYTLFRGISYASRDAGLDSINILSKKIKIYEVNLNGGGAEVVFNRLRGDTAQAGTIKLKSTLDSSENKTISINSMGLTVLGEDVAPTALPKKDSRHVHFDLGWSIQNAATLKFYFPGVPQIETVSMANYFNADKSNFDWAGSFSAGGATQEFRIHTHSLGVFNTLLSIHRDRDNGKNNQEVRIYIVDGGTDKEIAHYLANASDTIEQGSYVFNTMEIQ